jgi:hypothetical protein
MCRCRVRAQAYYNDAAGGAPPAGSYQQQPGDQQQQQQQQWQDRPQRTGGRGGMGGRGGGGGRGRGRDHTSHNNSYYNGSGARSDSYGSGPRGPVTYDEDSYEGGGSSSGGAYRGRGGGGRGYSRGGGGRRGGGGGGGRRAVSPEVAAVNEAISAAASWRQLLSILEQQVCVCGRVWSCAVPVLCVCL